MSALSRVARVLLGACFLAAMSVASAQTVTPAECGASASCIFVDVGGFDTSQAGMAFAWGFSGVIFCYLVGWGAASVMSMLDSRRDL